MITLVGTSALVPNARLAAAHALPAPFTARAVKKYVVCGASPCTRLEKSPLPGPNTREFAHAAGFVPPSASPQKSVTTGTSLPVDVTRPRKTAELPVMLSAAATVTAGGTTVSVVNVPLLSAQSPPRAFSA
jgi:hypothetical protein